MLTILLAALLAANPDNRPGIAASRGCGYRLQHQGESLASRGVDLPRPGMPYYTQTKAEEVFCSEADARAAGYRRALVR